MKKILLCVFFIIAITRASAGDIFDFSWNVGNIGGGGNYSASDDDTVEGTVSLLNFTIQHIYTNIGFEFSLIKIWDFFKWQNEVEKKYYLERFSFINTNIYWDLIDNNLILLGPFVSMNYLFITINGGININEFIFSSGLRFSLNSMHIVYQKNSQILSAEIGYRNIFGKNKLYFSVNFDLLLALMAIVEGERAKLDSK
jgi:hypothetical protein